MHENSNLITTLLIMGPQSEESADHFADCADIWGPSLGLCNIMSDCMRSTALLFLRDYTETLSIVLGRLKERDSKLKDYGYYVNKIKKIEKEKAKAPDKPEDIARHDRNQTKFEESKNAYFAMNELLKRQMTIIWNGRVSLAQSGTP